MKTRLLVVHVLCSVVLAAMVVGLVTVGTAQAVLVNIFSDEFSGTAVDAGKWDVSVSPSSSITVGGGKVNMNTLGDIGDYGYLKSNAMFDYGTFTKWTADIRFRVNSGGLLNNLSHRRETFLLVGHDGSFNVRDFDLRLLETTTADTNFDLGWHGFDNVNLGRNPERLPVGLARNTWHDVRVVHRLDNNVDIFVNDFGSPVATFPSITSAKASSFSIGDGTGSVNIDMDVDYVRLGALEVGDTWCFEEQLFNNSGGAPPGPWINGARWHYMDARIDSGLDNVGDFNEFQTYDDPIGTGHYIWRNASLGNYPHVGVTGVYEGGINPPVNSAYVVAVAWRGRRTSTPRFATTISMAATPVIPGTTGFCTGMPAQGRCKP